MIEPNPSDLVKKFYETCLSACSLPRARLEWLEEGFSAWGLRRSRAPRLVEPPASLAWITGVPYSCGVDRSDFERLRDMPGKVIASDIRLVRRANLVPRVADGILIENELQIPLRLNISFNPESGAKTVNVVIQGVGPICRLDVDGPAHRPAGRCHKHSLQTARCPGRNLPEAVIDRPDLSGKSIAEVFHVFCRLADIHHAGTFEP